MGMGMIGGCGRCPVCFGSMCHGQAIFTAECSHTFHLRCVPGNHVCPVCSARWRDTPSSPVTPPASVYDDDEPPLVEGSPAHTPIGGGRDAAAAAGGLLVLKTHCEYPALPKAAARDGFAVLVHAKAPAAAAAEATAARAPLDLVTVLDVSSSMQGDKLALVKRAMGFLVDSLGPGDRLSFVAFNDYGRRLIPLTRMSEDGKAAAKRAVESLVASGCTAIRDGLDQAAMVLDGRRHKNAVASVILLSDGQDNCSMPAHRAFRQGNRAAYMANNHSYLVPPSFVRAGCAGGSSTPVHAFGFGTDHDAAAMHGISEATGGTFSFIENHEVIQDAFARCVGGLLSVAAQNARVALECLHPGVRLRAVKSGRYESRIDAAGRAATVDVGELYADEDRRFLVFLDVPVDEAAAATRLLKVSCTYRDTATGQSVDVAGDDAVVQRPVEVAADVPPSLEVERERVRVGAAEDIALARAAAERGAYAEAARILDARRESLRRSSPALAGDAMCAALDAELHELRQRVSDEREYRLTGSACFLSGMSSHSQQRGSSVRLSRPLSGKNFGGVGSAMFTTPAMRKMESLSEMAPAAGADGEWEQGRRRRFSATVVYDDDDKPMGSPPAPESGNGVLVLNTHCEYPSIPNGEDREGFAVMLHVKAPALVGGESRRSGLDLVAALDVSGSMAGDKLAQVKRAMAFVVDRLGPGDRLSVVAFSDEARRVTRLTRMCEDGKAAAKRAVESLAAAGGSSATDVRAGLDEAAKLIQGSRHYNDAAGVVLVSDGHGIGTSATGEDATSDGRVLVPPFFLRDGGWRPNPVHAFVLGAGGHGSAAMHSISEATGGTFSFVEDHAGVQDAVAQCVGGLLSVTAQGVFIDVERWFPDVRIRAIKSGCYKSRITSQSCDSSEGWVSVGELYAGEERRFLFFLDVPSLDHAGNTATYLFKSKCNYLDMVTGQVLDIQPADVYAEVRRPVEATDAAPCTEVKRELLRVEAAEDMALARAAAERGDHAEAARVLDARRETVSRSAPALDGDAGCEALVAELGELSRRVADEQEYRRTGRACLLAAMRAHALQRGGSAMRLSARPLSAGGCPVSSAMFVTPAMRRMEKVSEMLRRQQQAPAMAMAPPPPVNGSRAVAPRSRLEARLALAAVPRLSVLRKYRRLLLRR
ncbi:LOW QUALITY PROTEIN: hypothetical protein U9M48_041068 [Paspalum notatum var. saurae]|uniref:VWFA domain-containing protein n=1 Tax=Paspalum notatum var. saurae TaxID=547442 RepID=A0AAQ3UMF2_PASNO